MIAMEFEYGYAFHCFFRLLSLSSLTSSPLLRKTSFRFCTCFSSVSMERAHCVYMCFAVRSWTFSVFVILMSGFMQRKFVCVCVRFVFFLSQLLVCLHFVSLLPCYTVAGGWWLLFAFYFSNMFLVL